MLYLAAIMASSTVDVATFPPSLKKKASYLSKEDLAKLESAYLVAEQAHRGMKRKSGEAFITHPVAVTEILAEMRLDPDALMAGLLHDTVEDTDVTFEELEQKFGTTVRKIVEGETKISKLAVRVYEDEQSENLRQMLMAMGNDVRIILVKLADRLHNMRTLAAMPPHKQQKISRETLEIFAPLAHRFGISHIKNELEDLSFFYLEPERYKSLQRQVRMRHAEREAYVQQSITDLKDRLKQEGIKYEVSGRSKHLYSIYRKMQRDGKTLDQIFDLMAIRAMVEPTQNGDATDEDEKAVCYRALGIVHSLWTPIPGRFKDYVAVPKQNGYQSLHTTVIGLRGLPIEVQIRTKRMHEIAEYGVAAHWAYKQGIETQVETMAKFIEDLRIAHSEAESAGGFVEAVKTDLLSERVLVFTPAGDIMNLPRGSTPIDFAYHVHTQIGHRCIGARVNGDIVPLSYQLQTGDRVEVLTNRSSQYGPSIDWLNFTVTRGAKQKIRQYFRLQERAGQLEAGKRMLERALRRKHLAVTQYTAKGKLEEVAKNLLHADSADELYLALNAKRLGTRQVLEMLAPEAYKTNQPARPANLQPAKSGIAGILLDGIDAPAKLALCCSPVRGDDVVGYITRGRGVTVHRVDCPNVKHLMQNKAEQERFVTVAWDAPGDEVFSVDFEVVAVDRSGLLKDILDVIAAMNKSAPKVGASVHNNTAHIHFRVDVRDQKEIEHIKENVSKIPDVTNVYRAKPGIKA
jgi:GTP diphosphokinase / guanosine-3',5'-bis(diphosphate) 3'-diphosphatase